MTKPKCKTKNQTFDGSKMDRIVYGSDLPCNPKEREPEVGLKCVLTDMKLLRGEITNVMDASLSKTMKGTPPFERKRIEMQEEQC